MSEHQLTDETAIRSALESVSELRISRDLVLDALTLGRTPWSNPTESRRFHVIVELPAEDGDPADAACVPLKISPQNPHFHLSPMQFLSERAQDRFMYASSIDDPTREEVEAELEDEITVHGVDVPVTYESVEERFDFASAGAENTGDAQ